MNLFGKRAKKTEHEYVEELLSAYLDDELTAQERGVVDRHLATCEDCQWSLDTLRQTVQWTAELPTIQLPRVFTIPVPAQPERAPRWRWSLPVLQGATALAALLLVFAVAGDFMLGAVMPGAVPSARLMLEEPAADAQVTLGTVETVVQEVVLEKEAAPAVEAPAEAEKIVEASAPPPAPAVAEPTQVVEQEIVVTSTATDENSAMGAAGFESPPPGTQDAVTETEGAGEARAAALEATSTESAYAVGGAQATETTLPTAEPTPTSLPTLSPAPPPTIAEPTVLAEAPPEAIVAIPEDEATTWQEPVAVGLDAAKIVLLVILALLATTTTVVMVRRRRIG